MSLLKATAPPDLLQVPFHVAKKRLCNLSHLTVRPWRYDDYPALLVPHRHLCQGVSLFAINANRMSLILLAQF
jgi:hypothetical protein